MRTAWIIYDNIELGSLAPVFISKKDAKKELKEIEELFIYKEDEGVPRFEIREIRLAD